MRKISFYWCLILVSFLCLACKEKKNEAVNILDPNFKDRTVFIQKLEKDFLGRVGYLEPKKPHLISSRIFNLYNNLSEEQISEFGLRTIFKNHKSSSQFGLAQEIRFSKTITSFVAYQYDENEQMHYKLINYTTNYDFIDAIDVSYFDLTKGMNQTDTYIYGNTLYVHNKETLKAIAYYLEIDGTFVKQDAPVTFNYLPLKEYQNADESISTFTKRVVKAKNGLIIRDSLGLKIGKFNYLETIYVLNYFDKAITVKDNGKTIRGKKAKVIIDTKSLNKAQNYYRYEVNMGYVFTGYLFDEINEDESDVYSYDGLTVNSNYIESFSLRELLDIKQVKPKVYLSKVIKTPSIEDVTKRYKKGKLITLKAENGFQVKFKDTTYQSEYEPTKTYYVAEDPNFENTFVVRSNMLFDYQHFYFINKTTGKQTNAYFGGHPHVSPNKDMIISIDYDAECPNQRSLFIDKITNGKISKVIQINYNIENFTELNSIKTFDKNEIYWLSNSSFIIKFWGANGCYEDSDNYFYYKFKMKADLLDILAYN